MNQNETTSTQKLAIAGVLTAAAVAGSLISVPVAGSKCAPVQHMVNIFAAVILGPWWGVGIAFCASLIRNLLGIGSLLAFPGSMVGALCCGLIFRFTCPESLLLPVLLKHSEPAFSADLPHTLSQNCSWDSRRQDLPCTCFRFLSQPSQEVSLLLYCFAFLKKARYFIQSGDNLCRTLLI